MNKITVKTSRDIRNLFGDYNREWIDKQDLLLFLNKYPYISKEDLIEFLK